MASTRSALLLVACAALFPSAAAAQEPAALTVRVASEGRPVPDALVSVGPREERTDESGLASFAIAAGMYDVRVEKAGYLVARATVTVPGSGATTVEVQLLEQAEEIEGVVVTSTRSRGGRRIEDEPLRVEVLAREEVEEKLMMTPGDIAMMLNETSGLRVQNTSPSLGGANVRVQGLSGRYTQVLSDGLPLYGGQSGSLSMLQIPPMDLGQVEVIKGVASALYGSSAMGGVVNLVSRRPEAGTELLLNRTTLRGTDAILYTGAEPSERIGYTLLAGLHGQGQTDVDGDGWADLAGYRRAVVRPRLLWNDGGEGTVLLTAGATFEDREGGTRPGRIAPGGSAFDEGLETVRGDVGGVAHRLIGPRLLTLRASLTAQRHEHTFGESTERDLHSTAFVEGSYAGEVARHAWLVGAALQQDSYEARDVPGFDYIHRTPSLFVQDEFSAAGWMTVAVSARVDDHSRYGAFVSPRVSLLLRPAGWTVRASAGTGYYAPTPFTEETEAVGLARVARPADLVAERARGASLDVGRSWQGVELNATLFGSVVEDPLQVRRDGDRLHLFNASGPTRTGGAEILARWNVEPLHVTATYTHVRSTEGAPEGAGRREVPLTPRHAAGLVGMWEWEGAGRIGLELYYTGRQDLDENPYRTRSRPYFIAGALAERRIGRARLFVNAENLLDVRQTRHDPLLLPERSAVGRWTTDVWAPLEGRVVNAGVRYEI